VYEKPELKNALHRTLGVPIFQEQVMQLAMDAAGFTAGEADALRRAMAAWKKTGDVTRFERRLIDGMRANDYSEEFAQRIYKQICGFGEYGFPESHAYSFALLAYASSYLKRHEPECFLAAMLNSQPMGFYTPSQLVQDAVRHGVEVRAIDVVHSDYDSTLEKLTRRDPKAGDRLNPAVRLGLRLVGNLSEAGAQRIVEARAEAPFTSVEDLSLRSQLDVRDVQALASADALRTLAGHRRQQVWEAASRHRAPELLRSAPVNEEALELPPPSEGEDILFDYAATGLTLRRHPVALLRAQLARRGMLSWRQLQDSKSGQKVRACGIVTVRQQPATANGTIFVTLEDETGPVNVIVWKHVREQQREALLRSRLLAVEGTWQRDVESGGEVRHLIAEQLTDLTRLLGRFGQLGSKSRDFH
jgi:error-prone DNA polymerase